MGSSITNIIPHGNMVLLRFHEVKEREMFVSSSSGILMPNAKAKDDKKKYYATVDKIGPGVGEVGFKVGDRVFYNDYDCKVFGDDNTNYGLLKADSIFASYTEED